MKQIIHAAGAPAAIGPYSHAIRSGGFLFTSGQIPISPATGKLAGSDIETQTNQVFDNLKAVLAAAGADFENVVKVTVYLADLKDFATVNRIYAERFGNEPPARTCIQAGALPSGALIEMDLIAALPE
jgi:2-iminobutanoate/2-iminopropanoate deaminase